MRSLTPKGYAFNMDPKQFKPAWWLRNSHLQTIFPTLCRGDIKDLQLNRERIELPDGDFIDIDWANKKKGIPIIIVLHGFEGSINSHYAKSTLRCIIQQGWCGAFMHFRGCSGEPNRLERGYHSGATDDLEFLVKLLCDREGNPPFCAIGYSLGGNILLKWLGETKDNNPLTAAIAISVPFDLHKASRRISSGFSRFYQWYLIRCARERLVKKFRERQSEVINAEIIAKVRSLREYDSIYTCPIHGFESVDEYYSVTSSRYYLRDIERPTLLLHAKDDPFMTEDSIPIPEELSSSVELIVTEQGGHVGFIEGKYPWAPEYWLEKCIPNYLKKYLK